jgi:hypothetical protein
MIFWAITGPAPCQVPTPCSPAVQIRIFKQSLHFLYPTFTMNDYILSSEGTDWP